MARDGKDVDLKDKASPAPLKDGLFRLFSAKLRSLGHDEVIKTIQLNDSNF